MRNRIKYFIVVSLLAALILSITSPAVLAQSNEPGNLEAFLDSSLKTGIEKHHIPNATVSVVKDGQMVYKKGFGFTDIDKGVPVDADKTLFRIGSTSKLITWTAVMQLVEAGVLDLDTDINTYLDFKIPPQLEKSLKETTVEPITLTHLMTHTSGFEDNSNVLFRISQDKLLPLDEYIKNYLPERIYPAGKVAAYSNYGTALAGYIVERVSGRTFSDYVDENIFKPLKMHHSTFEQPPSSDLTGNIAIPYRFVNGQYLEGSFEYIVPEPAGSMSTTSSDMANFMIAHLNGGIYNEERILKEESVAKMHKQHFTHDPDLGGMTLGFMEGVFNVKRVLFHGGGTMLFSTGLYLIPEENVGIFVSYSGGSNILHSEVFQGFMDKFYPVKATKAAVPGEGSRNRAKKFVGEYQQNRKNVTTDEKINSILGGGIIKVDMDKDGYLLVTNAGETNRFVETEPGVYQNLREGRTQDYFGPFHEIVFKVDPYGRTMLTPDGPMTYSKAPFYSSMNFTVSLLIIILFITIISIIYWLIAKLFFLFKKKRKESSKLAIIAQWAGIYAGIAIIAFFVGILSSGSVDPVYQLPQEAYNPAEGESLIDLIPLFIPILGVSLLAFTAIVWRKGFWKLFARIHYTLFTLTVLGLTWIFFYWNLF